MRYLSSPLTLSLFSRICFNTLPKNQTLAQSSIAHILARFLQMFSFEKGLWTSVYYLVYVFCYFATKHKEKHQMTNTWRLDSLNTKIMLLHVEYLLIYSVIIQSACEIHPFHVILYHTSRTAKYLRVSSIVITNVIIIIITYFFNYCYYTIREAANTNVT